MYSKARVVDGADTHEIITFGPLCVEPKWQGCGVGELLLRETMNLAATWIYNSFLMVLITKCYS